MFDVTLLTASGVSRTLEDDASRSIPAIVNAASGILDPAATVTPSEMWEHAFYQGLNLVQAAYLHAVPALSDRPSPALRLGCGWLTAAPWLLRHRFPVNSFSANWRATRQREERQERQQEQAGTKALGRTSTPTRLVRRMYMLKKGQYLLYKHVLLHGLNASLAVDGAAAFASERHFRQYWLCLNTAYVLEFFMQTLVKRRYMAQWWMLLLQQTLMLVSTVAALQVLANVKPLVCALSFGLNFARRGREVSNGVIVLAAALATGSVVG